MNIPFLRFRKESTKHDFLPIFLYNTLTKNKEEFKPIRERHVRMYNCGPTVYDYPHIGNFRAFIYADIFRHVFEYNNFEVKQVMNITDVGHLTGENEGNPDEGEDKVEHRAKQEKKKVVDIVKESTKVFFDDLKKLNAKNRNTIFPKASDYIGEQIAFVKTLDEKGYTYTTSDGVYFDTSKFKEYGKLGDISLEGLQEGARVSENPEKLHPTDFALWKFSRKDEKRQQEWKSPWGVGFPGWHLECSAMALKLLGRRLDIHTGGIDHIPTHHNNEIAQTESVTGDTFVNYWLHSAFITIEGKKISKSIGNTIFLYNITDRAISPLALRYWFLTAHYRSPINFTWDALEGAQTALFRLHRHFVEKLGTRKKGTVIESYRKKFHEYINDDIDTPKALALLHELMRDEGTLKQDARATFLDFDTVLGLGFKESNRQLLQNLSGKKKIAVDEIPKEVKDLVEKREIARKNKNWEEADSLRAQIESLGYTIEDSEDGPKILNT